MACTRKKQCLYGDICPTARSDEYNLIDASCYKPLEQTNEEWFCGLDTEDKARFISRQMYYGLMEYKTDMTRFTTEYWNQWLKEKHKDA